MSNILFITEGLVDEVNFINAIYNVCYKSKKYNIYSYKTTIHTLVSKLFVNGKIDKDLDIRLTLKENETDEEKREILSKTYSDIFLVFDLDPHHDNVKFKKIKMMLENFNDSTDKGKLYINYPMLQSFKHLRKMPDNEFKDRKVMLKDIAKYKNISSKESDYDNLTQYNYPILISIAIHHLKKFNYILNGEYEIPDIEGFFKLSHSKLYGKQIKMLSKLNEIYVINTSILNIIEYQPSKILSQVKNQAERFFI